MKRTSSSKLTLTRQTVRALDRGAVRQVAGGSFTAGGTLTQNTGNGGGTGNGGTVNGPDLTDIDLDTILTENLTKGVIGLC